jgi:hypothetical protein
MENKYEVIIDNNFEAVSLLDLNIESKDDNDIAYITIKYTWDQVDAGQLEKALVYFYNKVMDDNVKLEIHSDFSALSTELKIETLKVIFDNIDFCVDESIFEIFFSLTKIDAIEGNETWNKLLFNDAVEFVDIKLGLADRILNLIRKFIIYYMSLTANLTGNRVLHTSSFFELFLSTRKGIDYFGELLANFALSSVQPISSDEIYIVQNRDAIYSSMMLASTLTNNLKMLQDIACP